MGDIKPSSNSTVILSDVEFPRILMNGGTSELFRLLCAPHASSGHFAGLKEANILWLI